MTHRTKKDRVVFKPNIIGKSKNYKQIVTKHGLKFLDLINYVPAKTSLDKLVKSYSLSDEKGFFPYSTLGREGFSDLKMTLDLKADNFFVDDHFAAPQSSRSSLGKRMAILHYAYTQVDLSAVIYKMAVHLAQFGSCC